MALFSCFTASFMCFLIWRKENNGVRWWLVVDEEVRHDLRKLMLFSPVLAAQEMIPAPAYGFNPTCDSRSLKNPLVISLAKSQVPSKQY